MNKYKSQILVFVSIYSIIYLLFTTIIYYLSLTFGKEGLGLPIFGGGDDGILYYSEAINIANDLPYIYTSIHMVIFGWLFKVFNTENVYLLRFFNYIGTIGLILISIQLLSLSLKNKKNYYSSLLILIVLLTFYPSLILNTTLSIYRDIWIYFYFLLAIYLFIKVFIKPGKYPKILNLLLLFFSMAMLFGYRKYALLSFIIGSFIYLILVMNKKKYIDIKKAFVYLFTGFSLFYIFLKDFKVPFVNLSFSDVLAYRQSFIETYAGGSQMNISLDQSNIVLFYLNYLYSFLSNIIGPFPWQVNSMATLVIMLTEGIVFSLILIILFRNRKSFSNIDKYLLIQSIVWFMLIGLSNDNMGAGSRLRIVGWLPLIILFAKYYGKSMYIKRSSQKHEL